MQISVALASRNAGPHLGPLLESLARQTAPPHELAAYDDASEDGTAERLEEFAATAPFPVRIERGTDRRGPTDAFMAAARACSGEAVAFCDQDDVWMEDKLEVCGRELEQTGASLVMHSARLVDADLGELGRDWPEVGATQLVPPLGLTGLDVDAPGMAMVFRRELLDIAGFDERPPSRYDDGNRMLHDEWIYFLAGVAGAIKLIDTPLVLYRQHGANASGGWVDRRRELSLRPALGNYRRAAAHTAACAEYLARAGGLDAAAAAYRQAAENWRLRVSLYEAPDRRSRARLMRRLMDSRAYRARSVGGFGRKALGKDLAAGVALGRSGDDDG